MTAIITPTILAIVILIVRPKVITRIPKLRTTGSVSPKVSPKFSQVSHGISEARFPIKPPSTIPVSKNSSRIQKFFALLISVCSLPCIPVSNDFHLWGITPILLIVALTVPKGEVVAKEEKASGGISGSMIYFGALCLITGVFVATFNTNIAMYIDRKGIGDASTAGTVASIMQVIGILGGLVLGNTVKLFKRFTIGAAILMMAVGTAMVGFSTNLPVICVGAAVVGFGFAIRNPGAVTFAANMVPAAQASLAIAIVSATYNVGNFISAYVVNPLANMLGNDISNRFILSAVALAVIGIVACVKAPTTDAQALDSQG